MMAAVSVLKLLKEELQQDFTCIFKLRSVIFLNIGLLIPFLVDKCILITMKIWCAILSNLSHIKQFVAVYNGLSEYLQDPIFSTVFYLWRDIFIFFIIIKIICWKWHLEKFIFRTRESTRVCTCFACCWSQYDYLALLMVLQTLPAVIPEHWARYKLWVLWRITPKLK